MLSSIAKLENIHRTPTAKVNKPLAETPTQPIRVRVS